MWNWFRIVIARQAFQKGVTIVDGGYWESVKYEYVAFRQMKPKMMGGDRECWAGCYPIAEDSKGKMNKVMNDTDKVSSWDRETAIPILPIY